MFQFSVELTLKETQSYAIILTEGIVLQRNILVR